MVKLRLVVVFSSVVAALVAPVLWWLTRDLAILSVYLSCLVPSFVGVSVAWLIYHGSGYHDLSSERIARQPEAGVVIVVEANGKKILMNRQTGEPHPGLFILPGGYSRENEELAETGRRRFYEITGISEQKLEMIPDTPAVAVLDHDSFYVAEYLAQRSYSFSRAQAFLLERSDRQPLDETYIPPGNPNVQWMSLQDLSTETVQPYYKEIVEFALRFWAGDKPDVASLRYWTLTEDGKRYFHANRSK